MKKALYVFIIIAIVILILLFLGKKHISTAVLIDAPIDEVWRELTDFSRYSEWNPFIRKISGEVKKGNTIKVTFQIEGKRPMIFTPVVLLYEENSVFQWEGKLILPGIFTGRHTFKLNTIDGNKTKLVQKEDFKGILVPFFNFDSTIEGFSLMNRELKSRIEKK